MKQPLVCITAIEIGAEASEVKGNLSERVRAVDYAEDACSRARRQISFTGNISAVGEVI
jgi:uncharacterized metal-binding protein